MTPSHDRVAAIRQHLLQSAEALRSAADSCAGDIAAAADLIVACYRNGGKVLLCGNGGSAAQCQHLAAELVNVLSRDRPRAPLAAIALTTDTSLITAIANDFGFEKVFSRQVAALGRPGDVLLAISTSGGSANVIQAMLEARTAGMAVVLLTGEGGGAALAHADLAVRARSRSAQQVQEVHAAIGHVLCAEIEKAAFG